jgi:hypothetical protein
LWRQKPLNKKFKKLIPHLFSKIGPDKLFSGPEEIGVGFLNFDFLFLNFNFRYHAR